MVWENKPLESVTEKDLQDLKEENVSEQKTLDYKEELPGGGDADKVEFLCDVSSFANTSGGYILFGVKADKKRAIPTDICGFECPNEDETKLRLEHIARTGISPRIPALRTACVRLNSGRSVLVIHIPHSWAGPHMVSLQNRQLFYKRSTNGKYRMDVQELRGAFTLGDRLTAQIRAFRTERVDLVGAGETPMPLFNAAKIVLHVVPYGAFDAGAAMDVTSLKLHDVRLKPLTVKSWDYRYNFDGILTFICPPDTAAALSYVQVFSNGIIEAVDAAMLPRGGDASKIIPSRKFEEVLIEAVKRFVSVQKDLGVTPPVAILVSLVGVKGLTMAGSPRMTDEAQPIDRNVLIVPEVIVESLEFDAARILRPAFDRVWNAAGLRRSENYDNQGGRLIS